ncbi:MAG: hypothetical protein ABIU05_02035 [Nitrospirales bacterium]
MVAKKPADKRRQWYPGAKSMQGKSERLHLMCQDAKYTQHGINRVQFLALDEAIRLQFRWVAHAGVVLHVELTRHPKAKATQERIAYWWPVIEQWQKKLMEWQGPWTGGGLGHLLAVLRAKKKGGVKYSTLARTVNSLLRKDFAEDRTSSAREILDYFNPKLRLDEAVDHAGAVTASHIRERLRYAGKETS